MVVANDLSLQLAGEEAAGNGRESSKVCSESYWGIPVPMDREVDKVQRRAFERCWGYWELGAWKSLDLSARHRARLRKEVLIAGQDWPYGPARKEMRSKRKGHKCDRVSAEKRANTAELMKKMPDMLLDYKKRRWEKKMREVKLCLIHAAS